MPEWRVTVVAVLDHFRVELAEFNVAVRRALIDIDLKCVGH